MPNSIGRRAKASSSTEVEQLKKELAELKAAYVQDMQNITTDMTTLSTKIESPVVDTEVVS
jgi:hypothetical protein